VFDPAGHQEFPERGYGGAAVQQAGIGVGSAAIGPRIDV